MKNPALNTAILKILARVGCGLREETLRSETEIAVNDPCLPSYDFREAVGYLEDRGYVRQWVNAVGYRTWGVTDAGRDALKGL